MELENNINLENASIWVNGKELGNIKDFKMLEREIPEIK